MSVLVAKPRIAGENPTRIRTRTSARITLRCPVVGIPRPTVTWLRDGKEVSEGDRITILRDNSLVISTVEREDAGKYKCNAVNLLGNATKRTKLIVMCKSFGVLGSLRCVAG